jgi:hypothetical protein
MKYYHMVGIQCPICGQRRLRVIDTETKNQTRYAVSCPPMPEKAGAGVVMCVHGSWGDGSDEGKALRSALHNMVREIDANLKVKTGQRDHIVEALFKQLRQDIV